MMGPYLISANCSKHVGSDFGFSSSLDFHDFPLIGIFTLEKSNSKPLSNIGQPLHVLFSLVTAENYVHLLNADSFGFRDPEYYPHDQEYTENCIVCQLLQARSFSYK
jgi:hypothetical protein